MKMEKTFLFYQWEFNLWEIILLGVFALAILIQLIYNLRYFLAATRNKKQGSDSELEGVSIIICARNEEANLRELVPVIMEQDYPKFQLIVVNDSSWDDTHDILKALKVSFPEIHIIEIDEDKQLMQGKKFALTLGIKAAKHEIVLLTDADCRPYSKDWIREMTRGLGEKKEISLGFSGYKRYPGYLNKLIRFDAFVAGLNYLGYANLGIPYMGVGRNMAYTKTAFFRVGGFKAHYKLASGDDDLFVKDASNARNTIVNWDIQSQTISEPQRNWKKWSFQKKRHFTTAPLYKQGIKFRLILWPLTYFTFWFAAIGLGVLKPDLIYLAILLGVIFLRYLTQWIVLWVSAKRLGLSKDLVWLFPLLEKHLFLVHSMLYVHNLVRKPQKWN